MQISVNHRPSEAGFSLIEAMIASALFLMLLGGVSTLFGTTRDNYEDAAAKIDAQQTARIALEQVQRDLQVAGVGLSRLQPPFPIIVPRVDGGIDMRVNRGQVTTFVTTAMASTTDALVVDDAAQFAIGQFIAVYDATGSIDMVQITGLTTGPDTISHAGLSKLYSPDDGAAAAVVQTVSYRAQDAGGGIFDLIREVDGGSGAVVARNLTQVSFTFFDNAVPPAQFSPTGTAQQLLIRVIEARLDVRTEGPRLAGDGLPTIQLTTRVTPRSLVLF